MTGSIRRSVVPLYVLACLLLGGSTRSDWPNMLLQLGAIAILGWAALAEPRVQAGRPGRILFIIAAASVALLALELVPLPPALWSALPGRSGIVHGFALLGEPLPWLPLSLAPYATMTSALWLLPPLAVIAGMLRLGAYRELWLAIALLVAAFAGILLGALQVTSSDALASPWYLYPITNNGQAAGLFANSDHMATLLLATVPFVVAMYGVRRSRKRRAQASAGQIAILGGALLVVLTGIALNHSLAGLGLGVPVLAASLFVRAPLDRPRTRWGLAAVGLVGLLAVAAMFASPLQNNLTGAGADRDSMSRYTSFARSLKIAGEQFPVGSGSGSFAAVYPAHEDPAVVDRWFINHVHDDYIELALENGLVGIVLMLAFLLWWVGRVIAVWRAPSIDYFARAASIASGAMLAHSLVDFPLRTSALAALFAMCIALLAGPRRRLEQDGMTKSQDGEPGDGPRHLSVG